MELKFLELEICQERIKILPQYHQIIFLASICERLIPLYEIFANETEWEDASFSLIQDSLNEVWVFVENKTLNSLKLSNLLIYCQEIIPDGSCVSHRYVYESEYASRAICNILKFCLTSDDKFIKPIFSAAHYTIYDYLNWIIDQSDDPDKSAKERHKIIFNHPLTIREMTKENQDLKKLKKKSLLSTEFLNVFRNCSKHGIKHILHES